MSKLSLNLSPSLARVQTLSSFDVLHHLDSSPSEIVLIDVRQQDFEGGKIVGARHIPFDSWLLEEEKKSFFLIDSLIEENFVRSQKKIVFYCMFGQLRSIECAYRLLQRCSPEQAKQVFVLSGGFKNFLENFHQKLSLIEDFDSSFWSKEFVHKLDDFSKEI